MSSPGSVTHWIDQLKVGNHDDAAQKLWERYFQRLVNLASARLRSNPRAPDDGEDVVLSVFASFCVGARQGQLPQLNDRHDLWLFLVKNTARKAIDVARKELAQKRGGGKRTEATAEELQQVMGDEPTPDFAAQVAEECQRLLDLLPADDYRQLAQWRMEGYSLAQIARRMKCVERTIKRRLQVIRGLWGHEGKGHE